MTLTATNAGGPGSLTRTGYIVSAAPPPPAPVAAFSADVTTGQAPLAVHFTDQSTNSPTSWAWTFGDGTTATTQSPSHTYAAAGTYDVTLTATNAGGPGSLTRTGYIVVSAAPPPSGYSATVLADGPTSYWRLGETSGTAMADSAGTNPGTAKGGVTLGKPGALASDANTAIGVATNGYVEVANAAGLNYTGDFSIEAWAKLNAVNGVDAAGGRERGHQAEDDAGQHGDGDREREHAPVDADFGEPRDARRARARSSARVDQYATTSPAAPPARPSTTLSARNCCTSRAAAGAQRRAHRDLAVRPLARASSRFATLTQATSSTSVDRAEQDQQRRPDAADDPILQAAIAVITRSLLVRRKVRGEPPATVAIALWPASRSTPGLSRAIPPIHCAPRASLAMSRGLKISGRQYRAPAGTFRSGGAMPTIVNGLPSIRIVDPTIVGARTELPAPQTVADDHDVGADARRRPRPPGRGRAAARRRAR